MKMGDVIITPSDNIPTKKIVAVLGNVSARKFVMFNERPEKCFEELKKKAAAMGADAVINVIYRKPGLLENSANCNGLAVTLEDDVKKLCPKCKKELPDDKFPFCPHCGSSTT